MQIDKKEWGILVLAMVIIFTGSYVLIAMEPDPVEPIEQPPIEVEEEEKEPVNPQKPVPEDPEPVHVPPSVNGLLIGFDKSRGLTDVLMVGSVDTENNEVHVISIPRDLMIDFRKEPFKSIKESNPNNHVLYCKLTEIYYNLGKDQAALQTIQDVISEITGLEIDYMMTIDVDGFKDVVDLAGGFEYDVPERMYYSDPVQDLYIDLQAGKQHIDGDKAEQLVRYRRYKEGDLRRIQVQQDVLRALAAKLMTLDSVETLNNLSKTILRIFESDFGLLVAIDYIDYFYNETSDLASLLKAENMVTLPSYGELINDRWYQTWKMDEMHQTVNDLLDN